MAKENRQSQSAKLLRHSNVRQIRFWLQIHVGIQTFFGATICQNWKTFRRKRMQIGTTCQSHNISKVYVSYILPSTRTSIDIGQINEVINCTNGTKFWQTHLYWPYSFRNRPNLFQQSSAFETGLSVFHFEISKTKTKIIANSDYKNFNNAKCWSDIVTATSIVDNFVM